MIYSADYYDTHSTCDLVYIYSADYKEIEKKCNKNKSKSCFHIIEGVRTKVFMDELNRMWVYSQWKMAGIAKHEFVKLYDNGLEEEEEEEIAKNCGHKHDKARDFGNDNCYSCDMKGIFAPPPTGICPETGRKLNEIYDCNYCGIETNGTESLLDADDNTIYICGACSENEEEEEKEELLKKREVMSGACSDSEEEEDEEYEYGAYNLAKMFKARIFVGGAGYIEGEWNTEEDFNDGEPGEIFYCNYNSYPPTRRYEGTKIVWGRDDNFNVE